MKFKIKIKTAVIAAVNILSLGGALVLSLSASDMAQSRQYNFTAEKWQGSGGKESYCQISTFLSENSGLTTDMLGTVRTGITNALQTVSIAAKEGQKLCPDAYSALLGQSTVRCDSSGYSEAEITAVGGDFFLFRDFTLLSGAYFSDDDLMQDGIVIDRDIAWALYGSEDITGMELTINNVRFYISGVIDTPRDKEEKICRGEFPQAYITYDGASAIAASMGLFDAATGTSDFKKITSYEVVMPEPVSGFAKGSVSGIMQGFGGETLVNTGRFESGKRLKALKKVTQAAVRTTEIAYPYWENASRITEMKLSFTYLWRVLCLVIPAATLVYLVIRGAKTIKKYIVRGAVFVLDLIEKQKYKKWREKNEQKEAE